MPTEQDMRQLLCEARTMIYDMDAGYPTRELHRPPSELIDMISDALGNEDHIAYGEDEDDAR